MSQLKAYAQQAGFTGANADIAAAIAMAESGGNTQAIGPVGEKGVMQIYQKAHPGVSDSCAFDPLCSMQQAFNIAGGGVDFRPWCTFWSDGACGKNGGTVSGSTAPYRQFLPGSSGTTSTTGSTGSNLSSTINMNTGPTSTTQCAPWDIPCSVSEMVHSDWFQRANIVMIGLVLAVIGIFVLFVGHGAEVKSG